MAKVIHARYENGVLKPLEKLNLNGGRKLGLLFIEDLPMSSAFFFIEGHLI